MNKVTSRISLSSVLFAFFCFISTTLMGCVSNRCSNAECIQKSIQEGESQISELQSYRNYNLEPLYNQHSTEYNRYIQELNDIGDLEISSHEELLEKCRNDHYYQEICNKLERAAILKHSIEWLGSQINDIDFKVSALDQNVWKFKKKVELKELATSSEESDQIKELIASTEILLKEDTTPPEAQDVGKIEQEIFDSIINGDSQR